MLRSGAITLCSPNNLPRPGAGDEWVQDGWRPDWEGYGTFKQLTMSQAAPETGPGTVRTARVRTRGLPENVKPISGSWQLLAPDGVWYEVMNVTRTGRLVTLNLQEAAQQHGDNV